MMTGWHGNDFMQPGSPANTTPTLSSLLLEHPNQEMRESSPSTVDGEEIDCKENLLKLGIDIDAERKRHVARSSSDGIFVAYVKVGLLISRVLRNQINVDKIYSCSTS